MNKTITPLSLGTDRLSSLLLRYSLPAIVAMTSSSLYNIADSICIGHGVGPMGIAGLAITMPLMNLAAAFGSMIGIGAAAMISIRLGQGNRRAAELTLGNVMFLNLIISTIFTAITLPLLDPILYYFGASPQTIGYARDYMQIIIAGTIVTHLYLGLNEVVRASGYPKKAMTIMLTAVIGNVALNPLLIFTLGWGIRGAAIATVISQMVALCLSIHHFSNRNSYLHFKRDIFSLNPKIIIGIVSIGLAPFLLHACSSVVVIFINKALMIAGGAQGDIYVGAYGIVNRVVLLFVMVVVGLNQGMQPIVGYNYGAKKYDRVVKTLRMTIICAVTVTTTGSLLGHLIPRQIAMLFVGTDPDAQVIIDAAAYGLGVVLTIFPIVGFQIVTSNFFQYIGKPRKAIFLSLTRQMLFLVPLLILLPPRFGISGVWWAMPIADGVAALIAAILLYKQLRKFRQDPLHERSI